MRRESFKLISCFPTSQFPATICSENTSQNSFKFKVIPQKAFSEIALNVQNPSKRHLIFEGISKSDDLSTRKH